MIDIYIYTHPCNTFTYLQWVWGFGIRDPSDSLSRHLRFCRDSERFGGLSRPRVLDRVLQGVVFGFLLRGPCRDPLWLLGFLTKECDLGVGFFWY